MKLKLAGLFVLVVLLVAALSACSSASKATKGQTSLAQASQPASKPMLADTGKAARTMPSTTAMKTTATAMAMLRDIHFDYDRYNIRPADVEILKQDYAWFKTNPAAHVTVEGNCDERGSIEYNMALGQKRADATKNLLETLGVQAKMFKTVSYGKEKPIDPGHDEQAWAKNRRAHLEPDK